VSDRRLLRLLKPVVFLLCLVPLLLLIRGGFTGGWGPEPVDFVTDRTGNWAIRFLLLSLAMRPLRQLTHWHLPIRFRRMLGLFAFFYASLHLLIFLGLKNAFDWGELREDILDRPFVTLGFTAWLIMLSLALTSTRGWIRRLGGNRWQRLHSLVYVAIMAGTAHFLWARKLIETAPVVYTSAAVLLLGYRVMVWARPTLVSRSSSGMPADKTP
jgi:methionine sulfoxide reductase heme-binding subunit